MKRVLEFKEAMKEKKLRQFEEMQERQERSRKLKENITVSLEQSKKIKLEQNKLIAAQSKLKKIECEGIKKYNELDYVERNKIQCLGIREREVSGIRKKQQVEIDRKLKMKEDLEKKLLFEQRRKDEIENHIGHLEAEEVKFLRKLNESALTDDGYNKSSSNIRSKVRSSSTTAVRGSVFDQKVGGMTPTKERNVF